MLSGLHRDGGQLLGGWVRRINPQSASNRTDVPAEVLQVRRRVTNRHRKHPGHGWEGASRGAARGRKTAGGNTGRLPPTRPSACPYWIIMAPK